MVRTSEPKNQEFHKHNEPQSKIRCSYKKTTCIRLITNEMIEEDRRECLIID